MLEHLRLEDIRTDGNTQVRAEDHPEYAAALAADIKHGDILPEPLVVFDGTEYWLAQGFYRCRAAKLAGQNVIECEVIEGTLADAKWAAIPSNRAHGLRRNQRDIAKACRMAVRHPNSESLSNDALARYVGVSGPTIGKYRAEMKEEALSEPQTGPVQPMLPTASAVWDAAKKMDVPFDTTPTEPKQPESKTLGSPPVAVEAISVPTKPARPAKADAYLPPNQADENGNEVPQELLPVFEARPIFSTLCRRITEIAGEIVALSHTPAGFYLAETVDGLGDSLQDVVDVLQQCTPTYVDLESPAGFQPKDAA